MSSEQEYPNQQIDDGIAENATTSPHDSGHDSFPPLSNAFTPTDTGIPFFADATLDLAEAHDIAETPEPMKPSFDANQITKSNYRQLQLPNLMLASTAEGNEEEDENQGGIYNDALSSSSNRRRTASTASSSDLDPHQRSSPREKTRFSRITSVETERRVDVRPKVPPRWPRDLPWTIAFWLFVPISLIWPILKEEQEDQKSALAVYPQSVASVHALLWAAGSTLILSRLLYRTAGGGDGDDARHVVSQGLTLAAPLSVAVRIGLTLFLWWACPGARIIVLVPVWYTVRDLYLFRRWKRRSESAGSGSRQAFFQALTCMALDILSRSLRRASFYRMLSLLLLIQLGVLLLWRWALLGAIGSGSWIILLIAAVGGKWATGTVARFLSLLACGGVTGWFIEQSALLDEVVGPVNGQRRDGQDDTDADSAAYTSGGNNNIPDAYRTVDASVYQPVVAMDDGLDDDLEGEEDDNVFEAPGRNGSVRDHHDVPRSTVKSILWSGVTVSFGSVAQCGLFGGLAQFVWSQLRKVEVARTVISDARQRVDSGFRGMQIGNESRRSWRMCNGINSMLRSFVNRFSDLAMSHVAAYYKSYQRAARDVAFLIEESGKNLRPETCSFRFTLHLKTNFPVLFQELKQLFTTISQPICALRLEEGYPASSL